MWIFKFRKLYEQYIFNTHANPNPDKKIAIECKMKFINFLKTYIFHEYLATDILTSDKYKFIEICSESPTKILYFGENKIWEYIDGEKSIDIYRMIEFKPIDYFLYLLFLNWKIKKINSNKDKAIRQLKKINKMVKKRCSKTKFKFTS